MLFVILRQIGPWGPSCRKTQTFASLRELARFFASPAGDVWDSAEIMRGTPEAEGRIYAGDDLRKLATSEDCGR
jgi:hypothetical protein